MSETTRGRSQDRAKVAGGQDHEVKYEAGKTRVSKAEVKSAVKTVGNSRKRSRRSWAKSRLSGRIHKPTVQSPFLPGNHRSGDVAVQVFSRATSRKRARLSCPNCSRRLRA